MSSSHSSWTIQISKANSAFEYAVGLREKCFVGVSLDQFPLLAGNKTIYIANPG